LDTLDFADADLPGRARSLISSATTFCIVFRGKDAVALRDVVIGDRVDLGRLTTSRVRLASGIIALGTARGFQYALSGDEQETYLTLVAAASNETAGSRWDPNELQELPTNSELLERGTVFSRSEAQRRLGFFPSWAARGWLPVGDDGCGNYYVVLPEGCVVFVDSATTDSPAYVVASKLERFIGAMRGGISFFDEEALLEHDPDLARTSTLAALPWNA
jgi:hypothetical protein